MIKEARRVFAGAMWEFARLPARVGAPRVLVILGLLCGLQMAPLTAQELEDAGSLYSEALSYNAQRKLKLSRERLEKLIKDHPQHPLAQPAKLELAKILYDMREFDRSIDLLIPLADGTDASVNPGLAREILIKQLGELNRYKLGVELLEKWWEADHADTALGRKLASFYLQTGKSDEARLLLEGLLERTTNREVFQDLLTLSIKSGTLESLINTIEQRRFRYRTLEYLDFMTDCHLAMAQEKKAVELLREAPEVRNSVPLLKKLGRIELGLKEYEKAIEAFALIHRLNPLDWENVKALGDCHFLLGRKTEAMTIWKSPLSRQLYPAPEGYQMLADVLIEHQLYQEALDILSEARVAIGNPHLFAEDRARVLDSLNRKDEAIEEYLSALSYGSYRFDIFNKLYESQNASFSLKLRLQEAMKAGTNIALKKSLMEVLFREKRLETIPEFHAFDFSDGTLEYLLLERLQQAMTEDPSPFVHQLMLVLMQTYKRSSLALQIGSLILSHPDATKIQKAAALREAEALLIIEPCPDVTQKIRLLIDLGKFCQEQFADLRKAETFARAALDLQAESLHPAAAREGLFFLMRLEGINERFEPASRFLERAQGLPETDDETPARFALEKAWLAAHRGEFQPALDSLRTVIDEYPDSLWVNDALSFALSLTMSSEGDLDTLGNLLAAERATQRGDASAALILLEKVEKTATDTPLLKDIQAKRFLISLQASDPAFVTSNTAGLEAWMARNPAHWAIPDLMMLKWRRLRETPGNHESAVVELLKEFQERFPGDLRCRRVKLALQEIYRSKGGK
jgi:tetratricopeptide (TPR) repeat protein